MSQSLLETIREDHTNCLRNKNIVLRSLLGTVISDCEALSKSGKIAHALSDDEVVVVIQKTRKSMMQTIEIIATMEDRAEQKAKLHKEREYLEVYLPQALTKEELAQIAIQRETLNENLSQIMTHLKKNYAGRYDAREAHDIIKEVVASEKR